MRNERDLRRHNAAVAKQEHSDTERHEHANLQDAWFAIVYSPQLQIAALLRRHWAAQREVLVCTQIRRFIPAHTAGVMQSF